MKMYLKRLLRIVVRLVVVVVLQVGGVVYLSRGGGCLGDPGWASDLGRGGLGFFVPVSVPRGGLGCGGTGLSRVEGFAVDRLSQARGWEVCSEPALHDLRSVSACAGCGQQWLREDG